VTGSSQPDAADPGVQTKQSGYWPSPWPAEDGGPRRRQEADGAVSPALASTGVSVSSREAIAATMVVLREPGEVFILRHTAGPDAVSWVERIDPVTLEPLGRSDDLAGGPTWPGGLAAHANGSLHVVFGNHAHRLSAELEVLATTELPRRRPYNSFVVLPDGCLVTKDFGGVMPGQDPAAHRPEPAELLVLDPDDLHILDRATVPEPSIARLSADGDTVYVVGTSMLYRYRWEHGTLHRDDGFGAHYRSVEGQTYGWDPVLSLGAIWFLDNGEGSERYVGTFRGQGANAAPLHLVRVDESTHDVTLTEICGLPNGVVANPPLIDAQRRIAVGFDSGNGVVAAFDIADDGSTSLRWRREQNHASHMLLLPATGEIMTNDHDGVRMADQIVLLDITTGEERLRVDAGSPVQSVVFPAVGWNGDVYYCSFATVSRLGPA
jgi:hypothetical protein